jgi:hypothetical protein
MNNNNKNTIIIDYLTKWHLAAALARCRPERGLLERRSHRHPEEKPPAGCPPMLRRAEQMAGTDDRVPEPDENPV